MNTKGINLLVIFNMFIEPPKLSRLEDTEREEEDNTKNKRINTTKNNILCLKVES